MVEVIVTIVTPERKNENLGWEDVYVGTRVYRLEFETLAEAKQMMTFAVPVAIEQLTGRES